AGRQGPVGRYRARAARRAQEGRARPRGQGCARQGEEAEMKPAGAVVASLALALLASSPAAAGGGSISSPARRPEAERRRELAAEAQHHELKAQQTRLGRSLLDRAERPSELARAAILLEEAGAATSSDITLRYRLASVYALQDEPKKALVLLESIGRAD